MSHFNKYINPKGLIHIGAHGGGEYIDYVKFNINNLIFFEPQHYWYNQLLKNQQEILSRHPNRTTDRCINAAVGNFNGSSEMYIANNGASSSILEPKVHLTQHPDVLFKSRETVKVIRLDDFWETSDLKPEIFDTLTIDTQGYELEVLRGAINTLEHIDVIEVEVERVELYVNSTQIDQLDKFLTEHNFQRRLVSWCGGTWGDAIYTRPKSGNITEEMIKSLDSNLVSISDNCWHLKIRNGVIIGLTLKDGSCFSQILDGGVKVVHEDLFIDYEDLFRTYKSHVVACGG